MQPPEIQMVPPYSALAEVYDEVMRDVSYGVWTEYIDELICKHHPNPEDLMELACGTGTMALEMSLLDHYNILATDRSEHMIDAARKKGAAIGTSVTFKVMDVLHINVERLFDAVYMVFDSVNYLHRPSEILELHRQVLRYLKPGGLFLFDFTTPRNSQKAIQYLNNVSGETESYRYTRVSQYDHDRRIHTNKFVITETDDVLGEEASAVPRRYCEVHQQRIYTLEEMREILSKTDFHVLETYDGFTTKPAGKKSLRVTVVLQSS